MLAAVVVVLLLSPLSVANVGGQRKHLAERCEMSGIEKYNQAFTETFDIGLSDLGEQLKYQSVAQWDSVGHMALVAALEEAFDIMLEMDDIVDFESYVVGQDILSKYGVIF